VISEDISYPFQFDRIFGPDSTQSSVFEETATPLVNDVLAGYNATIFAYGQTGNFIKYNILVIHDYYQYYYCKVLVKLILWKVIL